MTVFPPSYSPESLPPARYSVSPSSLQTGALARALTNTAIRMIGHTANTAATAIARATAKRRPTIHRTGEMDDEEEELLKGVEDLARKAFVLFELGDGRMLAWNNLSRRAEGSGAAGAAVGGGGGVGPGGDDSSPFANDQIPVRAPRKSSSSSTNSEVWILRQQEQVAGEACVLYCKALGFIVKGTGMIQRFAEEKNGDGGGIKGGVELNESEFSFNPLVSDLLYLDFV
jgi:serine/threonine-protein kinase ULK/ATG1